MATNPQPMVIGLLEGDIALFKKWERPAACYREMNCEFDRMEAAVRPV